MTYAPDERQQYANGWPQSIDDSEAFSDWEWKAGFDLRSMVDDMMAALSKNPA